MKIGRREALGLLGLGAALPAFGAEPATAGTVAFGHGVASGDPLADRAIIWTRVTPEGSPLAVPLRWHVAYSAEAEPLLSGDVEARAAADYTAKVDATGLQPGREYWYWFETGGAASPKGRFRTLPVGHTPDVVLAVVTCQLYTAGFFNAYREIANLDRLDAVVHLGDYIYEYGNEGYGGSIGKKIGRLADPPYETITLADYRRRHALYKADLDLQAAHARAAMIAVWDDHETANDSWMGGAENHQPATEGDWKTREAAAIQAYFEWMPIRMPAPGHPWAINRSFDFGDLATLTMVETRLTARSRQAGYDVAGHDPGFKQTLAEMADPTREMLGEPQRHWLEGELGRSVASGRPWQVLGNQVVMARVAGPKLDAFLTRAQADTLFASLTPAVAAQLKTRLAAFEAGVPMRVDSWDGYPAARERLYETFRRTKARPIVLSGDSHCFWANELKDASGRLVGLEYGTSAITSPSEADALGGIPLDAVIEKINPEVRFTDQTAKGFILLTLTPEKAQGDYIAMSTVFSKDYQPRHLARFTTAAGTVPVPFQRS